MIVAFIQFCMVLNPSMCYPPIQIEASDGHHFASVGECAMAGMMISARFKYQGVEWDNKGIRCKELPKDNTIQAWVDEQKKK